MDLGLRPVPQDGRVLSLPAVRGASLGPAHQGYSRSPPPNAHCPGNSCSLGGGPTLQREQTPGSCGLLWGPSPHLHLKDHSTLAPEHQGGLAPANLVCNSLGWCCFIFQPSRVLPKIRGEVRTLTDTAYLGTMLSTVTNPFPIIPSLDTPRVHGP